MDREKANNLYDLLEDLYWNSSEEEIGEFIINLQNYLQDNFLKISNVWNLVK